MEVYCIYTNKLINEEQTSPEHIIPLSLGGCNEFTIPVDKNVNSQLGTEIDGKFANDFLVGLIRRKKDYRGHSKKKPEPTLKNSKIGEDERPVQVKFTNEKVQIFDLKERKDLDKDDVKDLVITSKFTLDIHIRMIFTAKVLLAGGYFVYGEVFKNYADHDSLRRLMNLNLTETKDSIAHLPIRVIDKFHPVAEEDKGLHVVNESICRHIGGSCIIFSLASANIIATVGIGGEFIGTINFKAKTEHFPDNEKFRLGHVIAIQEGKLAGDSFYDINVELLEYINTLKSDPS